MRILVVGTAGRNKGSESVIKSTIDSLRKFPDVNVYLLSMLPEIDSKHCEGKTLRYPRPSLGGITHFRKLLYIVLCFVLATMNKLLKINVSSLATMDKAGLLNLYGKADVVAFCTGDMISDTYGGLTTLIQFLKDILICTLLQKPIALNAIQIGPFQSNFKGKLSTFITKLVLNKANLITVRDNLSARSLRDMHISTPVSYITADPAFLLQPSSLERTKFILHREGVPEAKPLIGIVPSALIHRFYTGVDNEEKLEDYLELMGKTVDYLTEKLNATVLLLSHVFGPTSYDDRIIGERVLQRVRNKERIKLIRREYEAEELKGIIGQLDLLISTRMHPIIHAISMHTPVVGIGYTFKVSELMKRVDQQKYVCHITTLTYHELKSKIDNAFYNREKIRKTLKTKSEMLEDQAFLNAKLITDLRNRSIRGVSERDACMHGTKDHYSHYDAIN